MKFRRQVLAVAIASLFALPVYAQTQALNYEAKETSTVLTAGGVTNAWARGITGKGATIAIVDQGFDLTHKDFTGKIAGFQNFYGPTAQTWGEHGTLMAGIAAANKNDLGTVGVAPDAKLLLAQVGQGGTSTSVSKAAVYQAINWVSSQGATVINLSLGQAFDTTYQNGIKALAPGVFKSTAAGYSSTYNLNATDLQAYAVGTGRGSIIVAAAGNQGLAYSQFPGAFATQVDKSGNLVLGGRMLIVGATDATGKVMASFSNRAGTICNNVVGDVCKDPYLVKDFFVVAPGMQVYGTGANQMKMGTDGSYAVTGTSPATAYVSGGVALMKQAWPQLRPEQIVNIILNTAKSIGDSNVSGKGMVDFNAATQPMGSLQLANMTKLNGSGVQGATVAVASTGLSTSGSASLTTSSILKNAQAVDSMGRNYTVDMSRAINYNNSMSYQYGSPYMALAPSGYKHFVSPIGQDATLTFMGSDAGMASQYEWQYNKDTRVSFESGNISERNGFLGTQGYGAMGLGNSNTTWFGAGFKHNLVGDTHLIGNYTMGFTRAGNAANSMIALDSNLVSDSWKLGVAQDRILFKENKFKDTLSFAVTQPVSVRSGYARVSGVTGYTYSDNGDGTSTANPVAGTERTSLAPATRETNLVLGYSVAITGAKNMSYTTIGINLVQQFDVAGQPGVKGTGGSVMVRSYF